MGFRRGKEYWIKALSCIPFLVHFRSFAPCWKSGLLFSQLLQIGHTSLTRNATQLHIRFCTKVDIMIELHPQGVVTYLKCMFNIYLAMVEAKNLESCKNFILCLKNEIAIALFWKSKKCISNILFVLLRKQNQVHRTSHFMLVRFCSKVDRMKF